MGLIQRRDNDDHLKSQFDTDKKFGSVNEESETKMPNLVCQSCDGVIKSGCEVAYPTCGHIFHSSCTDALYYSPDCPVCLCGAENIKMPTFTCGQCGSIMSLPKDVAALPCGHVYHSSCHIENNGLPGCCYLCSDCEEIVISSGIFLKPSLLLDKIKELPEDLFSAYYMQTFVDDKPLFHKYFTNQGEGDIEYLLLLYIPSSAPAPASKKSESIKFFLEDRWYSHELDYVIPEYLDFLRVVVIMKQKLDITSFAFRRHVVKQLTVCEPEVKKLVRILKVDILDNAIKMIKRISGNSCDYLKFWNIYGNHIKWAMLVNSKDFFPLLRFKTILNAASFVSLNDYIQGSDGHSTILYIDESEISLWEEQEKPNAIVVGFPESIIIENSTYRGRRFLHCQPHY